MTVMQRSSPGEASSGEQDFRVSGLWHHLTGRSSTLQGRKVESISVEEETVLRFCVCNQHLTSSKHAHVLRIMAKNTTQ